MATRIIKPQPGFQENFLSTPADIAIGGGAAGAGKTMALLLEPLRHRKNANFGAVCFRRSYPEITMEGGLWDESMRLYSAVGARPFENDLQWGFQSGGKLTFRHMGSEAVLADYQGAQIPLIQFDELTHFTKKMFLNLLGRNRSATAGFRPYVRGTCNPDPNSFVAPFINWWIDQETGYPDMERAGKLRYMINDQNEIVWGNTRQEVYEKAPHAFDVEQFEGMTRDEKTAMVKSVTFIPGTIKDNPILMKNDPGYMGNLMAQDEVDQDRLLRGNWKVRSDKAQLFNFMRLDDMFTNMVDQKDRNYYISIDHARFGRDLCVIGTWHGWRLVRIDIIPKSDTNFILNVVKFLRRTYGGVPTSQIIIDQDGIGVKDSLNCHTFHGGGSEWPIKNDEKNPQERVGDLEQKRGFFNKRAQLYTFLSEKVNAAEIFVDKTNVWFHESETKTYRVDQIKVAGETKLIQEIIKEDLQKIRREGIDSEKKKKITSKEALKIALGGRSPDFGDMMMMRCEFEFLGKKKYLK